MTRGEAVRVVTALLPKLGGDPRMAVEGIPLGALQALLREESTPVTPLALIEVEAVLDFGARKHVGELLETGHGPGPWYHMAKAGKHLGSFLLGQTADPETGLHTLAHAAARMLLALEMLLRGAR